MADPSQAQGAQIPLQSFNIPAFPAEARSLKALTLTSEIKVDQYQSLLSQPWDVPTSIPAGIESLTLELFSLGFPIGFLTRLATRLPNLKSVVIYSQLFTGVTQKSQDDAVEFFKRLPNLRALHLLDVFAKPGFFNDVAKWLKYNTSDTPGEARRGLMFLEINYTFDHGDDGYMSRISASELASCIGPGLVSCSLNISPAEGETSDDGVMAFDSTVSTKLVKALTDEDTHPRGLRALNLTLFTLTIKQLQEVLKRHSHLMILNATVQADPGKEFKDAIVSAMQNCSGLEQVEIVIHPSLSFMQEVRFVSYSALTELTVWQLATSETSVLEKSFLSQSDIDEIGKKLTKLSSVTANVLRSSRFGNVSWKKKDGKWSR